MQILKGATSNTIYLMVLDASGDPLTGLTNTSVLKASFVKDRSLHATFTIQSLANPASAFTSGGFVEVDATDAPGLYRLDLPNTAVSGAGFDNVIIYLTFTVASGGFAAPLVIETNLKDFLNEVLKVDTIAELAQAAPAATPTWETALMLAYMMARNKLTSTAILQEITNDAGVVIAKSTLTFDVPTQKFTRAELVSGP